VLQQKNGREVSSERLPNQEKKRRRERKKKRNRVETPWTRDGCGLLTNQEDKNNT